jgi:radical SAM protein with 4Fe4S-binding SPASM domain
MKLSRRKFIIRSGLATCSLKLAPRRLWAKEDEYWLRGAMHYGKQEGGVVNCMLCPYLWREAMITINGDVLPCCNAHPSTPIMGNVSKSAFLSIWNNRIYRSMRAALVNGKPFQCCMHCYLLSGQVALDDEDAYLQYGAYDRSFAASPSRHREASGGE